MNMLTVGAAVAAIIGTAAAVVAGLWVDCGCGCGCGHGCLAVAGDCWSWRRLELWLWLLVLWLWLACGSIVAVDVALLCGCKICGCAPDCGETHAEGIGIAGKA